MFKPADAAISSRASRRDCRLRIVLLVVSHACPFHSCTTSVTYAPLRSRNAARHCMIRIALRPHLDDAVPAVTGSFGCSRKLKQQRPTPRQQPRTATADRAYPRPSSRTDASAYPHAENELERAQAQQLRPRRADPHCSVVTGRPGAHFAELLQQRVARSRRQ